jgi:hypothetical protein
MTMAYAYVHMSLFTTLSVQLAFSLTSTAALTRSVVQSSALAHVNTPAELMLLALL